MSRDPIEVVRAWFEAFNRSDLTALGELYADDAELDANDGMTLGRDAILASIGEGFRTRAGAFDNQLRRHIRTIGRIETGISTEWLSRERVNATGALEEATGYAHFVVEHGFVSRHREVTRLMDADRPADTVVRPSRRQYPERPIVGVGAVIVDNDRVVLIKRKFEPLAGQWSLPGGTLDIGESLTAGVAREAHEETGLLVDVGPVVEVFDRILFDPDGKVRYHFVLIDYLCRPIGGTLQASSDVADAVWAAAEELASYRMTSKAETIAARGLAMVAGGAAFA